MSTIEDDLAIRDVLSAYCQRCDDGAFDELAELFTPDASLVLRGDVVSGRSALGTWFAAAQPPEKRGKHLTTNAIVAVDGDRASVHSDFVFLRYEAGVLTPFAAGRYDDEMIRLDGAWRIARRAIQMLAPVDVASAARASSS